MTNGKAPGYDGEARLRAIFDNAADGVLVWGEDGLIHDANPAVEQLLGHDAGALNGASIDTLFRGGIAPAPSKGGRKKRPNVVKPFSAIALSKRWVGEVELMVRGGSRRLALVSITPVKDPDGTRSHVALVKDLAELEGLRQELRAEKDKTAAIVGAIADPLVMFDKEGGVEWSNDHAVFSFGRRRVVDGTPCHLLLCDQAAVCDTCPIVAFHRAAHNPGTVRVRRPVRTTEGAARPFEITLRRIPAAKGAPSTLAIFRDITEESGTEQRMRQRLRHDDLNLELSDLLLSAKTTDDMLGRFGDRVASALDLSTVAVLLSSQSGWLTPALVFHGGAVLDGIAPRIPPGTVGIKEVLSTGEPQLVRDVEKSAGGSRLSAVLERAGAPASNTLYLSPLVGRSGNTIGVLVVGHRAVDAFEQEDLELVRDVSQRLGLALDGALLAEANQRVLRLQEALLAEGDIITREGDLRQMAQRFLQVLGDSVGAISAGSVYLYPDRRSLRVFMKYDSGDRQTDESGEAFAVEQCKFLGRHIGSQEVLVIDVASMLAVERGDPVIKPFLEDGCDCLVLVPTGVEGQIAGWIVLALPSSLRVSTAAEVEVLRNLGQQTRLAIMNVLSQGRLDEARDMLEPR